MFHSYIEIKYDKVLTFNIAHFPNLQRLNKCKKYKSEN